MYEKGPAGIAIMAMESRAGTHGAVWQSGAAQGGSCTGHLGVRVGSCGVFQLDAGVMPAVPANQLRVEELLGIKGLPVLEDAVDGASELLGDDREGFGLAVLADQPLVKLFGRGVTLEKQTAR
jgi:hypothetical protein